MNLITVIYATNRATIPCMLLHIYKYIIVGSSVYVSGHVKHIIINKDIFVQEFPCNFISFNVNLYLEKSNYITYHI